jgi:hypothetical protein
MADILNIYDDDDLPCNDWIADADNLEACPMRGFWREGEVRVCCKCGWQIGFNLDENEDYGQPVLDAITDKYF